MPHLAVVGISGLATTVANLTADETLLKMLVEVVFHAPKAALYGNTAGISIVLNLLIHRWFRGSSSVDSAINTHHAQLFNDRQNAQVERQVSLLQMSLSWPASLLMRMLFQVLNQLRR